MAALGLRFCARALSSCGERGPLLIAVRGPLTIAASLVAEHRLQTRRLSNCGSRAQLLRGMWDPPRPGLQPVSPAPAGRLPTTAPPGKPQGVAFVCRVDAGSLPLYLQANQLERENRAGVMVVVMVLTEGKQLPFKGTIQKLYISLPLTVHWPELRHMGTHGQRKLGNIILTDWPCA